ncbi:hypothetical protein ABH966_002683 [Lysinibacillus sp. RC46]|uniref:hypothetical protein n=1 Tax=Lysinibacillus sp. RC46 TaxID=3156295 RepID=UPI003518AD04
MFETKNVHLNDLVLDPLNPRFTTREDRNFTETETIDYLIEYEELMTLAKSINSYGGFTPGERLIVVKENNKYVVLEGNRRVSSLKLLNNPKLTSLNKPIPKITKDCSQFIKEIPVDIVKYREDADKALLNRHIDGIRLWSQFSKMRFYKKMVDNGKTIDEIKSISPDSPLTIKRALQRYSILTNIIENYKIFCSDSTFIDNVVDTSLPTELIVYRFFTFFTDENGLNLKFSNDNELILPKNNMKQKLLLNILVLIAKMYWEEEIINTRLLNKKEEIYNFFEGKKINQKTPEVLNETHATLLELLTKYKNSEDGLDGLEAEQEVVSDSNIENDKDQIEPDDKREIDDSLENDRETDDSLENDWETDDSLEDGRETDDSLEDGRETDDSLEDGRETDDSLEDGRETDDSLVDNSTDKDKKQNNGGRKRKNPDEYDYLLKAYPFKNKYRENTRINAIIRELDKLEYKFFGLSVNFLMRSLLESYAYEYTRLFSNLDHTDENKLKGLTVKNFSSKELNEKFSQYIAQHIGKIEDGLYATTEARIISLFSKSNNFSLTQKLNQFVHLPDFNPTSFENLESWENICRIIKSMDEIIYKFSGQN